MIDESKIIPPAQKRLEDYTDVLGRIPLKHLPAIMNLSRRQVTTICSWKTPLPNRLKVVRETRKTVWTRPQWLLNYIQRNDRHFA